MASWCWKYPKVIKVNMVWVRGIKMEGLFCNLNFGMDLYTIGLLLYCITHPNWITVVHYGTLLKHRVLIIVFK